MANLPIDRAAMRETLEAAGLRCTPQRSAVYEQLAGADGHPTAEEIYRAVRASMPRISLATVYKALEALVSVGLAARLAPLEGDPAARYDARRDPHYHFRCLRTGAVHDLPTRFDPDLVSRLDPELADDLVRRGYRIVGYRLELIGYGREGDES